MVKQLVCKNTMEWLAEDIHHQQIFIESSKDETGEGKERSSSMLQVDEVEDALEKVNCTEIECHNELNSLNQQIAFLKVTVPFIRLFV